MSPNQLKNYLMNTPGFFDGRFRNVFGVGAKNGAAISAKEYGDGVLHQTVLTLTALSITMTDTGANGSHGGHKLYDFPLGQIEIVGATTDLTIVAAAGIGATAAVVSSIGTVVAANTNATLTSTEADIIAQTASTLTSSAGVMRGKLVPTLAAVGGIVTLTDSSAGTPADTITALADGSTYANDVASLRNNLASLAAKVNAILNGTKATRRIFDGTATAIDAFLNFAVPDAGATANSTLAVTGSILLSWINHGDN